jgi:hypothetical protein
MHLNIYFDGTLSLLFFLLSFFFVLSVFVGFENAEPVYTPYPDASINMRYIISVGRIILKENYNHFKLSTNDTIEIQKPNKKIQASNEATGEARSEGTRVHEISPILWHAVDLYMSIIEKCHVNAIEDTTFSLIECSLKLNDDHW